MHCGINTNKLIEILIIINLSSIILSQKIKEFSYVSEITIKIKGNGTQKILNSGFNKYPDAVYLNGSLLGEGICNVNLENEENILNMIWIENIDSCEKMFSSLTNIEEIDLSNFDTSLVTNMNSMFSGCSSLRSIKLLNVNTSQVKDMQKLFNNCRSLTSLDLSSFNTSILLRADYMFYSCQKLYFLNISSFNISSVISMASMFQGCNSLYYLNIANFGISNVKNLSYMFSGCKKLVSLDLSHFNTSFANNMSFMFAGCYNLAYLNIENFVTSLVEDMQSMFSSCKSLTSFDLSNFSTYSLQNMNKMFSKCTSLISLDLSNFNSEKIVHMSSTFADCSSLQYINLSNFKGENIIDISQLFKGCSSLVSLDLSSFDTKNVNTMSSIFSGCQSLKSLDLSNFYTPKVATLDNMFNDCRSLSSLDLTNFDTSNVVSMNNMFSNCIYLTSVDLSNFNTSKVTTMVEMFYNCSSLEYINFKNMYEISNLNTTNMLTTTPDNLIICINEINANIIKELMSTKGCNNIDCSSEWKENQQKIIDENVSCTLNCINNSVYIFEYNNKCYKDCPIGTKNNNNKCDLLIEIIPIIIEVTNISTNEVIDLNTFQVNGTHIIEVTNLNKSELTELNSIELTEIDTDLNLLNDTDSIENYIHQTDERTNLYTNKSTENYLFQSDLKLGQESAVINTEKESINNSLFFEEESDENSKNIDNVLYAKEIILKEYLKIFKTEDEKKELKHYIINEIMIGKMADILSLVVNAHKGITVKEDNDIYQISTLSNQLDDSYNISLIDFGECENILRQKYNLDENHEIIIFKIEHYILGNNIPIIEYALFNEDGKIKLNLEYCSNISVEYQIPVSINEDELYKYNPNGEYYNDQCYSDKSDRKVDITLYDRKNEYNDNNMSLCEKNCTYKSYNSFTKKVNCECKLKFKISFFEDIYIDKDKLLDKFVNIKSTTNILIIKCYKILFSKNGIIFNIGSYILLSFIFISIIQSFLFYFKGYNSLSDRIKRIVQINFQNVKSVFPLNDIAYKVESNSNIIKEKVKNKSIKKK